MSSDKPLSLPNPAPSVNSNTSPRAGGTSILNGSAGSNPGTAGSGPNPTGKVKTPTQPNAPTPSLQPNSHVLPHPTMPSTQTHNPNYAPHPSGPPGQYGYGPESSNFMPHNSQPYVNIDFQGQHHLSQSQPPTPQTATSGGSLNHFSSHPGPYSQGSHSGHASFSQFPHLPSTNGVSSPGQPGMPGSMPGQMGGALLPFPGSAGLTPAPSPLNSVAPSGPQTSPSTNGPGGSYNSTHTFDTTGQQAPPGMKPRVTATLWEDEGSLCFQVEAKGVCVARREDNHMINGTKLLNVAGMTRGRRDGILKSEKVRHVVKIGPMHLKGVWIPFERALDFANKEKITEMLYPLFVHNIGALLYHPTNSDRTAAVMAAADRRRFETNQTQPQQQGMVRRNPAELLPSSQGGPPMHHQGMGPLHLTSNLAPHPQMRPDMGQRAMTFPTPPGSASSLMNGQDNPYWSGPGMMSNSNSQPLAIDTVMNPSRSMPTTPATTPPGNALSQMQQYPQQNFNEPRSSPLYQAQPQNLSQQNIAQHNMARFGGPLPQPSQFMTQPRDNNMGPPPTSRGPITSRPSSRQQNADGVKDENGIEEQAALEEEEQDDHPEEETENDPDHEEVYTHHDANQYNNGNGRYYNNVEHTPHLSPEMSGSPNHQTPGTPNRTAYNAPNVSRGMDNGGGSTPRTATTPQQHQQWAPQQSGYSTPPRAGSAASNVRHPAPARGYDRVEGTNGTSNENYNPQGMAPQPQPFNGMNGSAKRFREIDDQDDHGSRPSSRGHDERGAEGDMSLKRRRTIREGQTQGAIGTGVNGPNMDRDGARLNRSRSAIVQRRGR